MKITSDPDYIFSYWYASYVATFSAEVIAVKVSAFEYVITNTPTHTAQIHTEGHTVLLLSQFNS